MADLIWSGSAVFRAWLSRGFVSDFILHMSDVQHLNWPKVNNSCERATVCYLLLYL